MNRTMLKRLCRSLAFHTIWSELTIQAIDGESAELTKETSLARQLIRQAGFNIDTLYPINERPIYQRSSPLCDHSALLPTMPAQAADAPFLPDTGEESGCQEQDPELAQFFSRVTQRKPSDPYIPDPFADFDG